jgi:hypothetical protein
MRGGGEHVAAHRLPTEWRLRLADRMLAALCARYRIPVELLDPREL